MKKLIIVFLLIAFLILIRLIDFSPFDQLREKTNLSEIIQLNKDYIITTPLVRLEPEDKQSFLTKSGIIEFTNLERGKIGLNLLKENKKLDISAQKKTEDMLEKQYFSHESPLGTSISELVEQANYEYILIGENLALGNFKDDEDLVQAWMNSPGHRENILNRKYREIGIGLIKGVFEGKNTWLIVQHFGFPLSACLEPDQLLKEKIENDQEKLQEIEKELDILQKKLNPRSKNYNDQVQEYNDLVQEYNQIHERLVVSLSQYNDQVKNFNACAEI